LVITLLIIVAISWIELEYYSEPPNIPETTRKIAHFVGLIAVMLVGYIGWYSNRIKWMKKVWLFTYMLMLFIILGVGFIEWKYDVFSTSFLDEIRNIRTFFSSPVPFLICWVGIIISRNMQNTSTTDQDHTK
jgi:UDP-N-acetylmuramyl pentapeptide phosphotransferase/UDP-N-acetylglucosamine-1-phosphate transferase